MFNDIYLAHWCDGRAGTVFWNYVDGAGTEPLGSHSTNKFTNDNYATYGASNVVSSFSTLHWMSHFFVSKPLQDEIMPQSLLESQWETNRRDRCL